MKTNIQTLIKKEDSFIEFSFLYKKPHVRRMVQKNSPAL